MTGRFPVHLAEEHSATLPRWWEQQRRGRTVVYLDAHLDLQQTDEAGIERLEACRGVDEFLALRSPHHLNPSDRYAYGIEDFLYPASRLGLLGRLVWVAPPHVPRRYSRVLVEFTQQMDGIGFDELTGFVPAGGGALRGTLLGLDITICAYDDLGGLDIDGDYDLDIDTDYFVEVPGDRLWIDPSTVVERVIEQLGPPALATVSRAVTSAFMPLAHRFVGDYVRAVLEGDDDGRAHHARLFELAAGNGNADAARALGERVMNARPDCPHARFLSSLCGTDPARADSLRESAAALDPCYGDDVSRDASAYPHRHMRLRPGVIDRLLAALPVEHDDTRRALGELAVSRLLAAAGRVDEAEALFLRQEGELADNGDIALAIARAHLARDAAERAVPWLEIAGQRHKTRTAAALLCGDLLLRGARAREALAHYDEAARRAPAWLLPLQRRRDCLRVLADHANARSLDAMIAERRRTIDALVRSAAANG